MQHLVDAALGAIGSAISMIKAGVTSVMNAVKNGMEWITNSVLMPIIEGIRSIFISTISSILLTMGQLLPISDIFYDSDQIDFTVNSVQITIDFLIDVSDYSLIILIAETEVFKIHTPFLFPVIETLAVSDIDMQRIDTQMYLTFGAALSTIPIGIIASQREKAIIPYTMSLLIMQSIYLAEVYSSSTDKEDTASYIATALETTGDAHMYGSLTMIALFTLGLLHLFGGTIAMFGGYMIAEGLLQENHVDGLILTALGLNDIVNHPDFNQERIMDMGVATYGVVGVTLAAVGIASTISIPKAVFNAFFAVLEFVGILTLFYFISTIIYGLLAK